MELTREKLEKVVKEIKERTTGVADYYPASVETWEVRALLDIVEAQEQQLAAAQAEAAKWQRAAERLAQQWADDTQCRNCPVAHGCAQADASVEECRERLLAWALQPVKCGTYTALYSAEPGTMTTDDKPVTPEEVKQ